MERPVRVAVVRSDNRRAAVAEALALIADDLKDVVAPRTLIKPNLVSHRYQPASTHADALSAALDAVLSAGAREVVVAEGASDATRGFESFGYQRHAWGRPVSFFDINRDENAWIPIGLLGVDGSTRTARLSATIAEAGCRVSLALAKTHVCATLTLSLKNMLSGLHPEDRVMMHGHAPGGNGFSGWRRPLVEFLKGDRPTVRWLTRAQGRLRNAANILRARDCPEAWQRFGASEAAFLRSVAVLHRNLVALNRRVRPHVSIVDGFLGMEREGPKHGTPVKLGAVVAGTDPVAVDAVAASVMGFEPRQIGFLTLAHEAGMGTVDLDAITVLGDPIAGVRRRFVPHSNHAVTRHWARATEAASSEGPAPHGRAGTTGATTRARA